MDAFKAPQGRKKMPLSEYVAGTTDSGSDSAAPSPPKRKKVLSAEAKERHKVCNRLGARRARAQQRLDMEVLKAQNALLSLELNMTRNALYKVAPPELCAQVVMNIEHAKIMLIESYSAPDAGSGDDDDDDDDEGGDSAATANEGPTGEFQEKLSVLCKYVEDNPVEPRAAAAAAARAERQIPLPPPLPLPSATSAPPVTAR